MNISKAVLAGIFSLAAAGAAADKPVDLAGAWTLDKTEENFIPMSPSDEGPMGGGMPGGGGRRRGSGDTYPGSEGSMPIPRKSATPGDLSLTIVQSPSEITLERHWTQGGQLRTARESYTLDGKENMNRDEAGRVELKAKAKWRKNGLVIDGVQQISTGNRTMEIRIKQELSLSKDGRQLTVTTSRESTRGQIVSKQIFTKS